MLVEVTSGVYAALQPEAGRFDDANVVVFVGERALLIVDAPTDAGLVAKLAAEITARFDRPVRYLVSSHWHGDHTQGNTGFREAFAGDLVIVGHRSLLEDVPGRAESALRDRVETLAGQIEAAEERLRLGVKRDGSKLTDEERPIALASIERGRAFVEHHRDMRFAAPDLALDERIRLDLGGLQVELLPLVAHTRGDVAVWAPERRVLAAGDVVDEMPYVGHGYPRHWVEALDRLSTLAPATVIPGHGATSSGTTQIARVRGYLADLVAAAERARAAGQDVTGAVAGFDAARWRAELARDDAARRFYDAVLEEALARAFEEERLVDAESAGRERVSPEER